MEAKVYNLKNEVVGIAELPERIFKVRWNPDLVNQARLVFAANRAAPYAHAKGRGEVRGGGRKPWRQKGTGRSRQGSIRSPIWKGGGVSHGPVKTKNTSRRLNKKMKQRAIFSILSKRQEDGKLKIIDTFGTEAKTKAMAAVLKTILGERANALLIGTPESREIHRAVSNLKGVGAVSAKSVNVYDLLQYGSVVIEKPALEVIEKHFTK